MMSVDEREQLHKPETQCDKVPCYLGDFYWAPLITRMQGGCFEGRFIVQLADNDT